MRNSHGVFKGTTEIVTAGSLFFFTTFSKHVKPFHRKEPKIGRNDLCPCMSGLKYKFCCGKEGAENQISVELSQYLLNVAND